MIVFVAALKQELADFGKVVAIDRREQVDGVSLAEGHADGVAVALVQSGIGRQRASEATRLAIARYRPDMIVSVGYSGGLSSEIRGSDLVLGRRLLAAEPASPATQAPRTSGRTSSRTSKMLRVVFMARQASWNATVLHYSTCKNLPWRSRENRTGVSTA